ncbi:hypothetical protein EI94DRAFT_1097954 [Lactarius quietus]|nr:hypothetical protein EI94DRAFT_1097954 [Lactarius quietus]
MTSGLHELHGRGGPQWHMAQRGARAPQSAHDHLLFIGARLRLAAAARRRLVVLLQAYTPAANCFFDEFLGSANPSRDFGPDRIRV